MTNARKPITVVITGASSGIGQATAEAFAQTGAHLVLAARGANALERVAQRCRELGGDAIAVPTDVTDAAAVQTLAASARDVTGTIDMWVSNVGVGAVGRYQDVPIAAHEQVVRANLLGHMNDAHAVLPIFLDQGFGTFVNMISTGGFAAVPYAVAYSASKFGLKGFSEALRGELALQPNIHVCDVYPAMIDTPGLAHAANYTGKKLAAPPPVADARRVAAAIVNLAHHPRNTVIVGQSARAARFSHFFAPSIGAKAMNSFFDRYFAKAEPAPVTDGNLFAAPAEGGGIDGGLRSPDQRRAGAAAGVVALAAFGVGAFLLRRGRR